MEIYVNKWRSTDLSQAFVLKSNGPSSTIIHLNSQILSKQLLVFATLFTYSSRSNEKDGRISGNTSRFQSPHQSSPTWQVEKSLSVTANTFCTSSGPPCQGISYPSRRFKLPLCYAIHIGNTKPLILLEVQVAVAS